MNFFKIGLIALHLVHFSFQMCSQSVGDVVKQVHVNRAVDQIILDGVFDEATWHNARPAHNFRQNFPVDSLPSISDTEVFMAYDDDHLYVFIKCHAIGNKFIVPSLRRDFDFFGNDNITILFDTYSDNTNAFVFGMNPYGARREATVSNSGQQFPDFDDSWDNKWDGSSKMYADSWTSEIAIPFSTLRFSKGSDQWRFNCYRYDTQNNEISSWIPIPRNRLVMDLGFMGNMVWEEPLAKTGRNISIIPYISNSVTRDFENPSEFSADNSFNAGVDAKISLTSGLNLDLTINPDFSQVEVDEQVTNLDRFEIFFPEKRQFFLENADLFGGFGASRLNPFFSRRIGVSIDPNTGQNIQNTILYGARLSGKLNDDLRVGFLNMQTASQRESGLPGFNFTVLTADQRISRSSRIALIGVNKQGINIGDLNEGFNEYNRVFGLEYRLNSPDNKWTGKTSFMKSFTPGTEAVSTAHFAQFQYNTRAVRLEWAHIYIGRGFNSEAGFAPRKDFMMISPEIAFNFYPGNPNVSSMEIGFDSRLFWRLSDQAMPYVSKLGIEEFNLEPYWDVSFANSSNFKVQSQISRITLTNDFDPTRQQEDGIFLPAGGTYTFGGVELAYRSDQRKKMSYGLTVNGGSFYNGSLFGLQGSLSYRYQPLGFVSMDISFNRLDLADPFKTANLWLIGPRIDFTFTRSIFLTTFIQYNNQLDNLNINTRFQWRFAPVSDFFLVYTDNYLTASGSPFGSRNRALVAKMTYWFNL